MRTPDEVLMTSRIRSVDAFLPLTPPMLHALLALADGDKHGYAILKEIARRTDGAVRLSAGTLYALVRRATADGLIVESDERPDISLDDERRRYYRLTPLGRRVAAAEIARLESIVEMARAKKLVPRSKTT
jgi:DNA-binding PadR family transcriptional regulator